MTGFLKKISIHKQAYLATMDEMEPDTNCSLKDLGLKEMVSGFSKKPNSFYFCF